ncbi:MAG: hypothetical protein ACT4PP_12955 [Sporichthyaceae bacterium]
MWDTAASVPICFWIDGAALVVLGAAVLVELVIDGCRRSGADMILNRYAASPALTVVSAAPGLIEAISAQRPLAHRGHLDAQDAARAAGWLREFDLTLDPTAPRLPGSGSCART